MRCLQGDAEQLCENCPLLASFVQLERIPLPSHEEYATALGFTTKKGARSMAAFDVIRTYQFEDRDFDAERVNLRPSTIRRCLSLP